jgi:hypothetical protein
MTKPAVVTRAAKRPAASRAVAPTSAPPAQDFRTPPIDIQFPPPMERPVKVPTVYADMVEDVIYGVHTTKVLFGEEVGQSPQLRSVAMVIIPTESLVAACMKILQNMSESNIVEHIDGRYREFAKQLKALQKTAKSKS